MNVDHLAHVEGLSGILLESSYKENSAGPGVRDGGDQDLWRLPISLYAFSRQATEKNIAKAGFRDTVEVPSGSRPALCEATMQWCQIIFDKMECISSHPSKYLPILLVYRGRTL